MIGAENSRAVAMCRPAAVGRSVLGVLMCVATALALNAAPALATGTPECPTESGETAQHRELREQTELRRHESDIIPGTARHYSQELPECRAYEMVSPLDKQGYSAGTGSQSGLEVLPMLAAPSGETLGWYSEGDFSQAENYRVNGNPLNVYISQRGASGWSTTSAFAPRTAVGLPFLNGLAGSDFTPDLRSVHASCGVTPTGEGEAGGQGVVCARREGEGPWVTTPRYESLSASNIAALADSYLGGAGSHEHELSRDFVQPEAPLLPQDKFVGNRAAIYEIAGVGYEVAGLRPAPSLRLVSVDRYGQGLVILQSEQLHSPSLGDRHIVGTVAGGYLHAISKSGEAVFFTATPNPVTIGEAPEALTVYARIPCNLEFPALECDTEREGSNAEGAGSKKVEVEGHVEGRQTVKVSDPNAEEGCEECNTAEPKSATFQGASTDGSKVFFTTTQELLNNDPTTNLYEYNFNGPKGKKLVLISRDESEGANVKGVVRVSADGSHVYFIASSVLTAVPNANGKAAEAGAQNLYVYDEKETEPIKFVAAGASLNLLDDPTDLNRHAQTTPDGRFLVFSSPEMLAGDLNEETAEEKTKGRPAPTAVYRYDSETGELTWVSHSAVEEGGKPFKNEESKVKYEGEGRPALIDARPDEHQVLSAATADVEDWSRAMSGEGEEAGEAPHGHDGEYIVFTTNERLQASDVNQSGDVYLWHNGTVRMISDGHDPQGVGNEGPANPANGEGGVTAAATSVSGSDIFFSTRTQLVGQDTDVLRDFYDARIDGGFKAPSVPIECPLESCQGPTSPPEEPGAAPSSLFSAGGNLVGAVGGTLAFQTATAKPKPLTRAQLLARALKACKPKRGRKQRVACERQAKAKYASKANAKKKAKAKKTDRRAT